MTNFTSRSLSLEDLEQQHTAELPRRDLLAAVTLFGFPIAGVSDVSVNVSGPGFLISR